MKDQQECGYCMSTALVTNNKPFGSSLELLIFSRLSRQVCSCIPPSSVWRRGMYVKTFHMSNNKTEGSMTVPLGVCQPPP